MKYITKIFQFEANETIIEVKTILDNVEDDLQGFIDHYVEDGFELHSIAPVLGSIIQEDEGKTYAATYTQALIVIFKRDSY
jgi:hypothetical protein